MNWVGPNAPAQEPRICSGRRSPWLRISSAERNSSRKYFWRRPMQASVAVDCIGFFGQVELRLVFGQDLAALGEPRVIDQDVEIIPHRLGEFRLRVHQVHDPQIRRKPGGESLEI